MDFFFGERRSIRLREAYNGGTPVLVCDLEDDVKSPIAYEIENDRIVRTVVLTRKIPTGSRISGSR